VSSQSSEASINSSNPAENSTKLQIRNFSIPLRGASMDKDSEFDLLPISNLFKPELAKMEECERGSPSSKTVKTPTRNPGIENPGRLRISRRMAAETP
jgi:hypothetical protein